MSTVIDGFPAAEGIASGPIHLMRWGIPTVPHEMVDPDEIEGEIERFHEAREWAKSRIAELKDATEDRLGPHEARIFDPQLLMLDDDEVVERTLRYIRENHLTAARAFEWSMLELQALWTRTRHPMVLDRLNDLEDIQIRMLHRLLDLPDPTDVSMDGEPVVVVTSNLTPTLTVQMNPDHVLGIATDLGTRTSHWAILARSLEIPAVVGLGTVSQEAQEGHEMILDGRIGRVILDPDDAERETFKQREEQLQAWEDEISLIATMDPVTDDGQPITLRANLDLPGEADRARIHGAQGVGLFRTEFLVMGRNSIPSEEEQYQAYKQVAESFPGHAVVIRTFDLGGDKFPKFLHGPPEENPFLGWRAIRVCLDEPELFRNQLRAILRATAHGDVRIMLPLVTRVEEVEETRRMLEEEEERLKAEGVPYNSGYKLGVLIETPAAALDATELARYSDFFSIGTNDLIQYTLAVDRSNARLAELFNPFHPSVLRQIDRVARASRDAGIEVSVCGEMAANPLGAFLLLGLDIHAFSVAWPSLPEVKKVIRQFRIEDARAAAKAALSATTEREVTERLVEGLGGGVDLSIFKGRWNLDEVGVTGPAAEGAGSAKD
ncbi:MAG: phosphoenolpyruvate--protein phosphotransferase [Longimicrobiales bacterium]|nr:phosphoenolpyruvate--protein phosphotransferase [Longimicrobiales bacterium]